MTIIGIAMVAALTEGSFVIGAPLRVGGLIVGKLGCPVGNVGVDNPGFVPLF